MSTPFNFPPPNVGALLQPPPGLAVTANPNVASTAVTASNANVSPETYDLVQAVQGKMKIEFWGFPEPFTAPDVVAYVTTGFCDAVREDVIRHAQSDPAKFSRATAFKYFCPFSPNLPVEYTMVLNSFRGSTYTPIDFGGASTSYDRALMELLTPRVPTLIILACAPYSGLKLAIQTSRSIGNPIGFANFTGEAPTNLGALDTYVDLRPYKAASSITSNPSMPPMTFLPDVTAVVKRSGLPMKNGHIHVGGIDMNSEAGKRFRRLFALSCIVIEEVSGDLDSESLELVLGEAGSAPYIDTKEFINTMFHAGLIRSDSPESAGDGPISFSRKLALYDRSIVPEALRLGGWRAIVADVRANPAEYE